MSEASSSRLVFLSHCQTDAAYADEMERILARLGADCWNFQSAVARGEPFAEKIEAVLNRCTHVMVLVGNSTKESRWVDMEMEVAMAGRESGPGAALIGVILPDHPDFDRPYYDPELVPVRLHDFITQEVAAIKKWTDDEQTVARWLEAADRRRSNCRGVRPSLETLRFIRQHHWTDEGEVPRPELYELSAQHRSLGKA